MSYLNLKEEDECCERRANKGKGIKTTSVNELVRVPR